MCRKLISFNGARARADRNLAHCNFVVETESEEHGDIGGMANVMRHHCEIFRECAWTGLSDCAISWILSTQSDTQTIGGKILHWHGTVQLIDLGTGRHNVDIYLNQWGFFK